MKVTTDACFFGAWVAQNPLQGRLLDIGAGTGLLSLMIRQQHQVNIDAVEIDDGAAADAALNFAASSWSKDLNAYHQDIRLWNAEPYDIIISNPPFYEQEIRSSSATKNLAHHSDELKFEDLMNVIKRLSHAGTNVFLHLPQKRWSAIATILQQYEWKVAAAAHLSPVKNKMPSRICLHLTRQHQDPEVQHYDIMEAGSYTSEIVGLLKPYYLKL